MIARGALSMCSALLALAGCSPGAAAPPAPTSCPAPLGRLAEGELAPEFVGLGDDGNAVSLSSLRSRMVVLFFYPDDAHPSRSDDERRLARAWAEGADIGAVVVGVTHSAVPEAASSRAAFRLVSDRDGAVSSAYGWSAPYDDEQRRTFVIGPDGRIEKVLCSP